MFYKLKLEDTDENKTESAINFTVNRCGNYHDISRPQRSCIATN